MRVMMYDITDTAMKLNMMVVMTMWLPRLAWR